ncbi:SpaH/EbpB family LPXTG-anchored major pilin [Streptococcus dysgalactiae]|uniref:Cell wall surface anchor family protein n=1 Tax=Streptococcus dysgalactiae TaxID=1334 RepID=A0A9X9QNL2_STRDY|nr:SpaH/EbpB family LPXTG-anchored major pilin [Streptococcus dysgalactiae]VTS77239.1 Cell wall surface anchor family protein [Streptococcus dysgalactiae]
MKLSKKLLYSAVVLATVAGPTVSPVAQFATSGIVVRAEDTLQSRTSSVVPSKTDIIITKLQADDYNDEIKPDGKKNPDGLPITDIQSLGTAVKPLANVTFVAYKLPSSISSAQIETLKTKKTVADVEAFLKTIQADIKKTKLSKTQENGETTFSVNKEDNGKYFVVEDLTAEGTPTTISSAYAVPFLLDVPMSTSDGSGYLTKVNIYPKNVTGETPKTGKDVNKLGENHASYNIGDAISWFIKGTVPKNIESYEHYEFKDTIDDKLDFVQVKEVKYGDQTLVVNEDYKVTLPTAENQKLLKVTLTDTGIKKIAKLYPSRTLVSDSEIADIDKNTGEKPFLQVEFITKINKNAVLGKPIDNKATIEFDNKPDNDKKPVPTPPSDEPDVQTGGKLFKKVGSDKAGEALAGAEFELQDESGVVVNWTDELLAANTDATMFAGKREVGQPIVLKSTGQTFGIRGLAYVATEPKADAPGQETVKTSSKTYKLKEIKAPAGYVIQEAPVVFEVNQTSYNKEPMTIQQDQSNAEPDVITNNKRPSIPNTGGIGTAIFVAIGAAVMAFAAKGMKRRTEEN